jgi:hypothetical protein
MEVSKKKDFNLILNSENEAVQAAIDRNYEEIEDMVWRIISKQIDLDDVKDDEESSNDIIKNVVFERNIINRNINKLLKSRFMYRKIVQCFLCFYYNPIKGNPPGVIYRDQVAMALADYPNGNTLEERYRKVMDQIRAMVKPRYSLNNAGIFRLALTEQMDREIIYLNPNFENDIICISQEMFDMDGTDYIKLLRANKKLLDVEIRPSRVYDTTSAARIMRR